jgi:phosphatidate cytidylyltransferase
MITEGNWSNPVYQELVVMVLAFILAIGAVLFFFRKQNPHWQAGWASFKSWMVAAPALFFIFGLPEPWTTIALTAFAILGAKIFFQITGMYHRSYFVLACYIGISAQAWAGYNQNDTLYNLMPMLVLGLTSLIPLYRNSFSKMLQYTAVTLINFIFLGWGVLHIVRIMQWQGGLFIALYLIILTEFCDNANLIFSRYGKIKVFSNVNRRRTLEGFLVSLVFTLALAWGLRHLLPNRSEIYWLTSGLIAAMGGGMGDMILTIYRRDLGVKNVGAFIIGRGDFLNLMDRLIFVAPIYYYIMGWMLEG